MPRPRKTPLPPLPTELSIISLGKRISNFRKIRGKTQNVLAASIGISRSHLASYETEALHLNDEMIIRFAKALGISTDDLLGYSAKTEYKENSPSLRLIKRMQEIQKRSVSDQKFVIKIIDTFLKSKSNKAYSV